METYKTILRAAQIIERNRLFMMKKVFKANPRTNRIYHFSVARVQGLRPDTENDNQLTFEREDGVFKEIQSIKKSKRIEKPQLSKRPLKKCLTKIL